MIAARYSSRAVFPRVDAQVMEVRRTTSALSTAWWTLYDYARFQGTVRTIERIVLGLEALNNTLALGVEALNRTNFLVPTPTQLAIEGQPTTPLEIELHPTSPDTNNRPVLADTLKSSVVPSDAMANTSIAPSQVAPDRDRGHDHIQRSPTRGRLVVKLRRILSAR